MSGRSIVKELGKLAPCIRNKALERSSRSEMAQATVYQKHRSLLNRKMRYRADACPVLEGYGIR